MEIAPRSSGRVIERQRIATILIVDDLPSNRTVLVTLLQSHGHRLLEAADGRDGLAAVRADVEHAVDTAVVKHLRKVAALPHRVDLAAVVVAGVANDAQTAPKVPQQSASWMRLDRCS